VKQIATVLLMIMVLSGSVFGEKFIVSISGNLLKPSDENYKKIYGDNVYYPDLKAGYHLVRDIYLWIGYAYSVENGKTPVPEEESKTTQHFLSSGAGYSGNLVGRMGYDVELGVVHIRYREEAMDAEFTGSKIGFQIGGALNFKISQRLFAGFSTGYITASDTVNDQSIKLGGFRVGLGIRIKF
jgi:opacity protein-like surface antigen